MKKIIIIILQLCFLTIGWAQLPAKAEKKREKARQKLDEGKVEDARKILRKLVTEYPWAGSCWDLLGNVELTDYLQKKKTDKLFENMKVTVKKDGQEVENDSLASALKDLFKQSSPSQIQYTKMIEMLREASLNCGTTENVSILYRSFVIDEPVDTAVSREAYREFMKAEEQFQKRNYAEAIRYYKKAAELDTTFFKARLYLGDAYYGNKEYAEAARYFKEAVKVKPTSCEARKYLTDAYMGQQEYGLAEKECIQSLMLYPDVGMIFKLQDIEESKGKKFERFWMPRKVYPNLNTTQSTTDADWKIYLEALKEIKPYCNEQGIIVKENSVTKSKYAEVYAWEKMLKGAAADKFGFVRNLQNNGWLECYVLFSIYHFDLQKQYRHFVNSNPGKLESYIEYLISIS